MAAFFRTKQATLSNTQINPPVTSIRKVFTNKRLFQNIQHQTPQSAFSIKKNLQTTDCSKPPTSNIQFHNRSFQQEKHLQPTECSKTSNLKHRAFEQNQFRFASKYNTAIRTATPFSTCCKIIDWPLSATSLSSSTPRLIGPGCMITISFCRLSSSFRLMP